MRITPDTAANHVARAYGRHGGAVEGQPRDTPASLAAHRTDLVDIATSGAASTQHAALIAAQVEHPVEFTEPRAATVVGAALPFYRRPAEANAAATGVVAGRILDVSG